MSATRHFNHPSNGAYRSTQCIMNEELDADSIQQEIDPLFDRSASVNSMPGFIGHYIYKTNHPQICMSLPLYLVCDLCHQFLF